MSIDDSDPVAEFLHKLGHLRKFSAGGHKALHKPLTLLYALSELKHRRSETIRYRLADEVVTPILVKFGPSGSRARVADPFARLEGDRLWKIRTANREEIFDAAGNARPGALSRLDVEAGFDPETLRLLRSKPELIDEAVRVIVEAHIPPDIRETVLHMVGWGLHR
jgi:putative restriction endonuclease